MSIKNLNNSLKLINDYEEEINESRSYRKPTETVIDSTFAIEVIDSVFVNEVTNFTFVTEVTLLTLIRRDRERSRRI